GVSKSMRFLPAILLAVALLGCTGAEPKTETAESGKVTVGMSVDEVRKLKGEPTKTDHVHEGSKHLDVAEWSDLKATFEGGKVVRVDPK
ncbi:MAG: hypothetical protein ACOYON_16145, partial [Fimbriimonas sp.]